MAGILINRDKLKQSLTILLGVSLFMPFYKANAQQITILTSQGQPAVNMVVYLQPKDISHLLVDTAPVKAEVHQKDKQFSPYITVVQKGQEVAFVNDDDITHHIYSALGPKRFSFKLRQEQQKQLILFENAGHVSMGCNIHDWMSGHLLVVDTPFYAITDDKGTVVFDVLPTDEYSVVVWHPQLKLKDNQQLQTMSLPSEQMVSITLDAEFDNIPKQQSLDEFDFLEGY